MNFAEKNTLALPSLFKQYGFDWTYIVHQSLEGIGHDSITAGHHALRSVRTTASTAIGSSSILSTLVCVFA